MPYGLDCEPYIRLTNTPYAYIFTYSAPKAKARYPEHNSVKAKAQIVDGDGKNMKPEGSTLLPNGQTMFRYRVAKMRNGVYTACSQVGIVSFVVMNGDVATAYLIENKEKPNGNNSGNS